MCSNSPFLTGITQAINVQNKNGIIKDYVAAYLVPTLVSTFNFDVVSHPLLKIKCTYSKTLQKYNQHQLRNNNANTFQV